MDATNTNTKTQQIRVDRHIVETHLTSLSDSKTREKTLLLYITDNIPPISTQHGFKSNHSTSTALHNINKTKQTPERTVAVALDIINKAFDTVNIHTLTYKQHQTNISQIHRKLHQRTQIIHHI